MSRIALEFKNIRKRFPHAEADSVSGVSLTVNEGDFVTILGTSGSGKTTMLKMVNRIYESTSGDIFFYGENIKKLKVEDYRRKIGYVIQQIGLFPHMTVADNIATVPKILRWSKEKINARVDELLELVGLPGESYRERYPSQLSGGQQQRIGLARAMAADPQVMLMDEPFGAIDAITRQNLQDELIRIQTKLNKTILFVTHDIHEAFKLGNKVIIMDQGKVQQFDTPYNILFHPANEFVAQLVASENIINRLKILKAETAVQPLTRDPDDSDIYIGKDEFLDSVLSKFFESGRKSIIVKDADGQPVGEIAWDQLNGLLQSQADGAQTGSPSRNGEKVNIHAPIHR
ncbi:ABC transporter ATP-binding protein [Paenibacillus sp. 7124]|uniref:Carnitine transport ATP-binding protein OpuCA n=1 Tax=Paenibacillus apii TaxID=1850370 RepID=A0A6M1PJ61_9BACL|nr:ABC transporter ATP-binding protein [Paenibacillus apii]NGM82428.1 ABC transporter ATP-binding protein [Paenibacillus apii]NJJ39565.1 ABC transporter ATP-binding protein [Paenibacillus apii]